MSILKNKTNRHNAEECKLFIRPVRDVIEIIGGKWRLPILTALSFKKHRFNELQIQVDGITSRMLSRELKDLELNGLIEKNSLPETTSISEYNLTPYGKSLDNILVSMRTWGTNHREKIMNV